MASSESSGGVINSLTRRGAERDRGIPRNCRCGAMSIIKTADTLKNPGRLFYCCPYGSKEDNTHLFKWTDMSMVEEIEEVDSVVEKIQIDVASLEKGLHDLEGEMEILACDTRTCEVVSNSLEKKLECVKELAEGSEKEIGELRSRLSCCEKEIEELRSSKNLIVCVLVMFVVYWFVFV